MEDGVWRTIGGRHVFIEKGKSLSQAMKDSGKFNTSKRSKKNEQSKKTQIDKQDTNSNSTKVEHGHVFDVGHYTYEELNKNAFVSRETEDGYIVGSGDKEGIEPKAKDRVIYNMSKEREKNLSSKERQALKDITDNNNKTDDLIQENTDIYNTKTSRKKWVEEHRGEHGKHTSEAKTVEEYYKELSTSDKEKIRINEEKIDQLHKDSLKKAEVLKENEGKYPIKKEKSYGKQTSANIKYRIAYGDYMAEHPNSKMTFSEFKEMTYK